MNNQYKILDSGAGKRLEKLGEYTLVRPYSQAIWDISDKRAWALASSEFHGEMDGGRGCWKVKTSLQGDFQCQVGKLNFLVKLTDYGHVGFFAEQEKNWQWLSRYAKPGGRYLNLFAYTGGSTMAAALPDSQVTHVDAAKSVVNWARKNARLNNLPEDSVRWIAEDAKKFVAREIKRKNYYNGIILDPPSFGRGPKGETWKIEKDLLPLLKDLKKLLHRDTHFFLLTAHTAGFTGNILKNTLLNVFPERKIEAGEMLLEELTKRKLSAGFFARWT